MTERAEQFTFDRERLLAVTRDEEYDADVVDEVARRVGNPGTQSIAVAHYRNAVGVKEGLTQALSTIFEQMAEAMYWQGEFAAAAVITNDPMKYRDYQKHAAALAKLDTPICECPPIRTPSPTDAKGVSSEARREVQRVFVGEIGREVAFIKCEQCKQLFAQTAT